MFQEVHFCAIVKCAELIKGAQKCTNLVTLVKIVPKLLLLSVMYYYKNAPI